MSSEWIGYVCLTLGVLFISAAAALSMKPIEASDPSLIASASVGMFELFIADVRSVLGWVK